MELFTSKAKLKSLKMDNLSVPQGGFLPSFILKAKPQELFQRKDFNGWETAA